MHKNQYFLANLVNLGLTTAPTAFSEFITCACVMEREGEKEREREREGGGEGEGKTDRQTDRQTQTGRKTDRQTDRQMEGVKDLR